MLLHIKVNTFDKQIPMFPFLPVLYEYFWTKIPYLSAFLGEDCRIHCSKSEYCMIHKIIVGPRGKALGWAFRINVTNHMQNCHDKVGADLGAVLSLPWLESIKWISHNQWISSWSSFLNQGLMQVCLAGRTSPVFIT